MEWVESLQGQIVGLDTAPLIYFIERHAVYLPLLQPFFEAVELGTVHVVSSTLTLTEILTQPLRHGDYALARQYSQILLTAANVRMIDVSSRIASDAARLRAKRGYKTPDAIQLATAIAAGATWFVTNDQALTEAPGLRVVVLKSFLRGVPR